MPHPEIPRTERSDRAEKHPRFHFRTIVGEVLALKDMRRFLLAYLRIWQFHGQVIRFRFNSPGGNLPNRDIVFCTRCSLNYLLLMRLSHFAHIYF